MKRKIKGFTLFELMIVLAIIGILAAIAVPNMVMYVRNSKTDTADSQAKAIYNAAQTVVQKCEVRERSMDAETAGNVDFYLGGGALYFGKNLNSASFSDNAQNMEVYEEIKSLYPNLEKRRWFIKINNYKVEYVYYSDYNSSDSSLYDVYVGSYPDSYTPNRGTKTDGGIWTSWLNKT